MLTEEGGDLSGREPAPASPAAAFSTSQQAPAWASGPEGRDRASACPGLLGPSPSYGKASCSGSSPGQRVP